MMGWGTGETFRTELSEKRRSTAWAGFNERESGKKKGGGERFQDSEGKKFDCAKISVVFWLSCGSQRKKKRGEVNRDPQEP